MKSRTNWRLWLVAIAGGSVGGVIACSAIFGLTYNSTASMPRGVWQRQGAIAGLEQLPYRQAVTLCPPKVEATRLVIERGYLQASDACDGSPVLMKRVVARPGDTVDVGADYIAFYPRDPAQASQRAALHRRDKLGRELIAMTPGKYVVADGTVWLLADGEYSFDSRYYGPVDIRQLQSRVRPLLTFARSAP
jgi:conjugative transfer signal peptidase TraF